jgi:hypothetical protein
MCSTKERAREIAQEKLKCIEIIKSIFHPDKMECAECAVCSLRIKYVGELLEDATNKIMKSMEDFEECGK